MPATSARALQTVVAPGEEFAIKANSGEGMGRLAGGKAIDLE
jgi:hypothetical protein